MVYRSIAAAAALLLSVGVTQGREAKAPKATAPTAESSASGSTADPMDVPRGMRDWFAKSVDDILTDDEPVAPEKPRARR